jgi:hypothetical protein
MPRNAAGIWESEYVAPAAREMPSIRAYLYDLFADPTMHTFFAGAVREGKTVWRPARDPLVAARILLNTERERLADAELWWVSPEMTRVATVAARTLPENLTIEEMHQPSRHGFVVFGEPVGTYLGDGLGDRRVNIAAMSWGPAPASSLRCDGPATWVTFYSRGDAEYVGEASRVVLGRRPRPAELDWARRAAPEWMWDNEMILAHQETIGAVNASHQVLAEGKRDTQSLLIWVKILYASWLLMTQPGVTAVEQLRANRQQQRRDQRLGTRTPSDVRIVHVHGQHRDTPTRPGEQGSREYTVRWLVSGHWRDQAYGPQRSLRRPMWINPHVKGPAGKPLKTASVVHVWDR